MRLNDLNILSWYKILPAECKVSLLHSMFALHFIFRHVNIILHTRMIWYSSYFIPLLYFFLSFYIYIWLLLQSWQISNQIYKLLRRDKIQYHSRKVTFFRQFTFLPNEIHSQITIYFVNVIHGKVTLRDRRIAIVIVKITISITPFEI